MMVVRPTSPSVHGRPALTICETGWKNETDTPKSPVRVLPR